MDFDLDRAGQDEEDMMLAALLALHRRKQKKARRDPRSDYERVLQGFEARGQRLRGERLMISELVERLFEGSRSLPVRKLQQELEITGPAGAAAAGRFGVTNRSAGRERFELVAGEPMEDGPRPQLVFEPAAGELEPGERLRVRVEAGLQGFEAGASVTVPVECRWRYGRDRLWLVVSARPAGESR
jgi:hypothetical protein